MTLTLIHSSRFRSASASTDASLSVNGPSYIIDRIFVDDEFTHEEAREIEECRRSTAPLRVPGRRLREID